MGVLLLKLQLGLRLDPPQAVHSMLLVFVELVDELVSLGLQLKRHIFQFMGIYRALLGNSWKLVCRLHVRLRPELLTALLTHFLQVHGVVL